MVLFQVNRISFFSMTVKKYHDYKQLKESFALAHSYRVLDVHNGREGAVKQKKAEKFHPDQIEKAARECGQ